MESEWGHFSANKSFLLTIQKTRVKLPADCIILFLLVGKKKKEIVVKLLILSVLFLFAGVFMYGQEAAAPEKTDAEKPSAETKDGEEEKDPDSNWYGESVLYFGASFRNSVLEVSKSGKTCGTMTPHLFLQPTVFLGYNTKSYYFGKSHFGFYFSSNMGLIDIDKQYYDDPASTENIHDLGTSIKGLFAYFTPVVFYNWGKRSPKPTDKLRLRVGLGLGASFFKIDGDIIFTELPSQEEYDIHLSGIGYSFEILAEYRIGNWILRATTHAPVISRGGYDYLFIDGSVDFGYAIAF